jgi:hypothetical protein
VRDQSRFARALRKQLASILRTMITGGRITGRAPSILTLAQEYGLSAAKAVQGDHQGPPGA